MSDKSLVEGQGKEFDGLRRDKHVLEETSYCATMHEQLRVDGRPRCTAAGRYMDTEGRVVCARCAAGRVVVKLTDLPRVIDLVDQITSPGPHHDHSVDDLRAMLRPLISRAPREEDVA